MKRLAPLAALLALACATDAAAAGRQSAIGLDMVRLLDVGQFEPDDGTLNLFFQGYLTQQTAFTFGYAWGDRSSIPELGYKIYNQQYLSGTYWQVGLASIDVDGTAYNHEPAAWGSFGFEKQAVENVYISGAAKAYVGVDHPKTGDKEIIFVPTLSVMFAF